MRYRYLAVGKDGARAEGAMEAPDEAAVLAALTAKGLTPLSVRRSRFLAALGAERRVLGARITLTDKIFLTRYLSLMLRVNTDLFKAINILIADFRKPAMKAILTEIRGALERGQPFYATFARHREQFSPVFVNMIKAGEASGTLERVLADLSRSLDREKAFKGKLRSALVYPAILFVLSVVIVFFLLTFALPKIAGIFEGGGIEPPLFSRVVFGVGLFLGNYIGLFLLTFGVLAVGLALVAWRTSWGRRAWQRLVYRTPLVRNFLSKISLERFASVMSSLLRSGLPITEAIETTADAVGQAELRDALQRIARQGVARGVSLGESFGREPVFPAVVRNLVAISERAGHLDEVLATLAEFYEGEIDTGLKTFIAFVEPIMLLFIGMVVGVIALSIIVPIYQLVGQF